MQARQQEHIEGRLTLDQWLITRVGDIVVYVSVLIGYLSNLLGGAAPTAAGFALFTGANALYLLLVGLTWTRRQRLGRVDRRVMAGLIALCALAIFTLLLEPLGIDFDGLIFLATVIMLMLTLPTLAGLVATALLYLTLPAGLLLTTGTLNHDRDWLSLLAAFVFVVAFSYANRLLAVERDRSAKLLRRLELSHHDLEQAHHRLQQYAAEVEELTVARERTRIARDIHDTLGHYLTILNIQLETIGKLQEKDPAAAAKELAEARRVAAQSMQEVRNAVAALRPNSLAELSLPGALAQLGAEFRRAAAGTALTLDLETEIPPLSPDLQLALYRAAQEALTNVRKHARASKVLLRMRYENEAIELLVLDNGQAPAGEFGAGVSSGFGLLGLRERVELLGGEVAYGYAEPGGYRVTVRLPMSQDRAALVAAEA